nr:response regulator [Candidatus Neomarinimicrobiota bacterium]
MKILVVDDERAQREALAGFLRSLEHDVAIANSAQTALAHLYKKPADVVLTDYKMPYMTGNDLLKEIRGRYPGMVVLIMTAYGTVEVAVEAMKAGAWDFVAKPVDLDQLELQLQAIEKFIEQRQAAAIPAETSDNEFIAIDAVMQNILVKARRV